MCRKASAIVAGWLTLTSAAWAQSNHTSGAVGQKVKPLSPYHATASTMDWAGEASDMPLEMPNVVVPRSAVGRMASMQPPAAPVTPPTTSPVPAITGATSAPAVQGMGAACGQQPSTNCCTPCNQCCDPCGPNGPCGPQGRVWGGIEYLLWTTSGMNVPPLVTSSPLGTPREAAGVLGDPRTSILFGGGNVNDDFRSGFRAYSGMWLDECQTIGLESSLFYLEPGNDSGAFPCFTNSMIFARPFFDVNPANTRPNSELVCFPNVLAGGVWVNTQSTFWGSDFNIRKNLFCDCNYRLDFLAGYRYWELQDRVNITENLTAVDPNTGTPVGTNFVINEFFYTKNTFNGGQIGLAGEFRRGRFFVSGRQLVAFGNVHKEVEIAGVTQFTVPGQLPQQYTGGLLTQPTNIGKREYDVFAVVPEATVSVGYNVTDGIRAYVGYTFLYISDVSRAGNQIDTVVNSTQIPPGVLVGAPRPAFVRQDSDFWAQGINFGLEIRF